MTDPTPNGQTWVCRNGRPTARCVEDCPVAAGCGPVPPAPSSDTPSDERRWCALCGTWEDEADWITHSGHASLFPTDDVRHADAVTAEPEWSTRPVPSSDTPSDERCPVCGAPVHPQPPFRYAAPSSSPVAEASGRPDPLHLPKARAVIEWWLADEFGSLDAAVEGVLWTGPEEPREQVEQVLDALRQVLKTQEFEDD